MNGGRIPAGKRYNGRTSKNQKNLMVACFFLVWLFILGIIFFVDFLIDNDKDHETDDGKSSESITDTVNKDDTSGEVGDTSDNDYSDTEAAVTEPDPVTYSEATVLSAGDLIFHMAQINYADAVGKDGVHDFTNSFKYIKDIVSGADYAVANFETTLSGADKEYSGYPSFNAPDSSLTAIKDAGFDLMLYANNHCYDKNLDGLLRTQKTFEDYGLDYIGAKKEIGADAYTVVDLNGIKVGMFNYAEDLRGENVDERTINGKKIKNDDLYYMNLYNLMLLDELYADIDRVMAKMEDEGVDIVIAYMHWGAEYNIKHNRHQEKVAQALTDRGVDVIIGGHPHVIQDVATLTSAVDPSHKTLCFYSLGNLVSNQNRRTLGDTKNSTYTEGGLMVEVTVRKYSTGETMVSAVREIPTFVHRYKVSNGFTVHEIVPLDAALADPEAYGLNETSWGKNEAKEVLGLQRDVLGGVTEAYNAAVVLPVINEE